MKIACRLLNSLIAALLLFALVLTPEPVAAGDPIPELFGPSQAAESARAAQPTTLALRSRMAGFNPAALDAVHTALAHHQKPGPLALSLFPGTRLVAHFERVEDSLGDIQTLVGTIEGSSSGEIHLSRSGDSFFGSLNTGSALYELKSLDGLSAQILEVDTTRLPQEEDLVLPDDLAAGPAALPDVETGSTTTDDGSRIDVFVGYTSTARAAAGSTSQMLSRIATAIQETNTGYANSGINQRVVLMGSAEFAYSELAGTSGWSQMLHDWSDPSNPVFSPAHTARNAVKADEMVLIVDNLTYCGLGYLMRSFEISTSFASSAFALVSLDCATGYYSFAHEMGHNMGAHHDKVSAGTDQGAYPYSYGYWIPNTVSGLFDHRTIMAYDTKPTYPYSSLRVNYWSNPAITYGGSPVGTAEANNAQTLNDTASTVAQFRDGAVPLAPVSLTASAQGTATQLSWTCSGTDIRKFRVERASFGQSNWVEIGSTPANILTYTDTTAANQSFAYRVLSDNGNGRTASNVASNLNQPTGLQVLHNSGTQYQLTWNDNASNESGYEIQRAPGGSDVWTTIAASVPASPYPENPGPGEFRYRVRAVGAVGVFSFFSNLGYTLPNPPSGLSAAAVSQARVRLSWTDHSLIESGFSFEVSVEGSLWNPLTLLAPESNINPTSNDVNDLVCGHTRYDFGVRAQSAPGSYSDYTTLAVPFYTPACVAPDKPGSATAVGMDPFSILLRWGDVDGETGFRVEETSTHRLWFLGRHVTSYRVTGLKPATRYDFRVYALNNLALGNEDSAPAEVSGFTRSATFMPRITR